MIPTFRAELIKLARPQGAARHRRARRRRRCGRRGRRARRGRACRPAFDGRGVTVDELSGAGGGTEVFRTSRRSRARSCSSCSSRLVAVEFTRGTMRTMFLRQPRPRPLLGGPGRRPRRLRRRGAGCHLGSDLDRCACHRYRCRGSRPTGGRPSPGCGSAVTDYGMVLAWVTGYAVLGHDGRGPVPLAAPRPRRRHRLGRPRRAPAAGRMEPSDERSPACPRGLRRGGHDAGVRRSSDSRPPPRTCSSRAPSPSSCSPVETSPPDGPRSGGGLRRRAPGAAPRAAAVGRRRRRREQGLGQSSTGRRSSWSSRTHIRSVSTWKRRSPSRRRHARASTRRGPGTWTRRRTASRWTGSSVCSAGPVA